MILQFRTRRNANGHCAYLALDTTAQTYATEPRSWISKDIPELKSRDLEMLLDRVAADGWERVPNM